jgi:hypothetical protein
VPPPQRDRLETGRPLPGRRDASWSLARPNRRSAHRRETTPKSNHDT